MLMLSNIKPFGKNDSLDNLVVTLNMQADKQWSIEKKVLKRRFFFFFSYCHTLIWQLTAIIKLHHYSRVFGTNEERLDGQLDMLWLGATLQKIVWARWWKKYITTMKGEKLKVSCNMVRTTQPAKIAFLEMRLAFFRLLFFLATFSRGLSTRDRGTTLTTLKIQLRTTRTVINWEVKENVNRPSTRHTLPSACELVCRF